MKVITFATVIVWTMSQLLFVYTKQKPKKKNTTLSIAEQVILTPEYIHTVFLQTYLIRKHVDDENKIHTINPNISNWWQKKHTIMEQIFFRIMKEKQNFEKNGIIFKIYTHTPISDTIGTYRSILSDLNVFSNDEMDDLQDTFEGAMDMDALGFTAKNLTYDTNFTILQPLNDKNLNGYAAVMQTEDHVIGFKIYKQR